MKVLLLTWKDIRHPFAWWAEQVMYEYAQWLVKRGHQVTRFGYSFKGGKSNEIIDGIQIIRKFSPYTSYLFFPHYYKHHFAGKYDVIIDEAGGLPFLSPTFAKTIPIFLFIHHVLDTERWHAFSFPFSFFGKLFYSWILRQYKNIPTITVSLSSKEELVHDFGFADKKIHVIESACDIQPISAVDWSAKKNIVSFLGRLMPIKRVEDAIRSFGVLVQKMPEYTLQIIGNDQDKQYVRRVKKLVWHLGLQESVNFLWYIPRDALWRHLPQSKLLLVPSQKEGFGLVVLEGNCYGVPAIGYAVPGLKESIHDRVNGVLVADGDWQAMGQTMISLLSNPEKIKNLSNSALSRVKNLDTWESKVVLLEKILSE